MPETVAEGTELSQVDCPLSFSDNKENVTETAVTSLSDSYDTLKEFGRGRFAKVIAVRHRASGEQRAAKLQRWRRFLGSKRSIRSLVDTELAVLNLARGHSCFVQLHSFLSTPAEAVILLEACQHGSLQDAIAGIVRDTELLEARHLRFCRLAVARLLAALQFLHSRRLCHLDVKPCNLLLRRQYPDCDLCLCDFGLVKLLADETAANVTLDGTPDYAAPEVLAYEPISTAVDMWSAGAVLYFVATGQSPFAASVTEPKEMVYSRVATVGCDWSPLVGHSAEELTRLLLQKSPGRRPTADAALGHEFLAPVVAELPWQPAE